MPELIFPGPEGRLEGRYHPQAQPDAPLAIVLHPHPQYGGTMNNRVVYNLHYAFHRMGFTVLRFWNDDILLHTDGVLESIWAALRAAAPSP